MRICAAIMVFVATTASAETVVPTRTIRAKSLITASDLVVKAVDITGAISRPEDIVGQEARVTLYAGRPVRMADVGPPAIIERNQIISLVYVANGLSILTEGRALERVGIGDQIRVMNLASRTSVTGQVLADGRVRVSN